jgi:hypothetical protein
LEETPEDLYLISSNCGARVQKLSQEKQDELFDELETYDVKHNDQALRNITYSQQLGRFCLIDFEFATILSTGEGIEVADAEAEHQRMKELAKESGLSNPADEADE